MATMLASKKPVKAQPKLASPCRSRAAVGSAVATAMASKAMRVTTMISPMLSRRSSPPKIDSADESASGSTRI